MSPSTVAPATLQIGSRFRTIQSQVSTIPFDAGNTRSVELPRSFPYKLLRCRLRGSINSGSQATPINESPFGIVKRVDLVADGRKVLFSVAGIDAYRLSNLFQGKAGELIPIPTTAGNFSGAFFLHNEAARMLSPIMSYFDPRPYEKVELRVQWGTVADAFTTVNTGAFGADTAFDVQVAQSASGEDQIAYNRLLFFDEITYAGAVSNNTINVPRAGLLAGILLRVYASNAPTNAFFQSATAGATNNTGTISLKSDNNFLHLDNVNATQLQVSNVIDYQLDGFTGGTGGTNIGVGIVGNYYIDLTEDGLMTSLLNTFDLNVLQLILTSASGIAATTYTVRITYVFYEPITAA